MDKTKPFCIEKQLVMDAYLKVKANRGAAGIDDVTIEGFEKDLKNNLYKIWNRLSSGTYFPPAVKAVAIPKSDGGTRILGVPTIADRVAQTVIKMQLEPLVEPKFHSDSYGYRPGKSALDAVGMARKRCWKYDWVIDYDIKGFFDNLNHDLVLKAVKHHTDSKWILLYVERWLKAPLQKEDGTLVPRDRGTPQGGVISPLLANIFMHHALDDWMRRCFPGVPFERYADDGLAHCTSQAQARKVLEAMKMRLQECRLEIHPDKTRIVYCKDVDRKGSHEHEKFDFLGFTFRPRLSKNKMGKLFMNFSPAISSKAAKSIRDEIRKWKIHLRSDKQIDDLARMFNAQVQGWINYYGAYYRSALRPILSQFERELVRWAKRKYKKMRGHHMRAVFWLGRVSRREPKLFAHWRFGVNSSVGKMGAV